MIVGFYRNFSTLYTKIKTYENLHLNTDTLTKEYGRVRNKITRIKHEQTIQISNELINLALYGDCATISVEKLSWLNSQGGKWNHSAIQQKIQESCNLHNVAFTEVNAHNTSKINPITNEIGVVKDRNIEFNEGCIDRDILASVNVSYRAGNKTIKPKINVNKSNKNRHTPKRVSKKLTYQQKQKIKQLIDEIRLTKTSGLVGSGGYNVVRNGRVIVLPIVSSLVNTKKFIKQQFVSISDRL